MSVLSLFAKLGLDKRGFDAGLNSAGKSVDKFSSDLKSALAGAFTLAAVTQAVRGITTAVNRVKDLSEQFGITTDEVQKADFALKQSGMTIEDIAGPMNKLASSRREAVEGNEDLRKSFAKFGITVRDLNDPLVRNFDLLMMISKAMQDGTVRADQQSFIMDLLGTKAGKLANVLQGLSAIEPPKIFDASTIREIDEATKAIERFKLAAQIEGASFISKILAGIEEGSGRLDQALHRGSAPIGLEELQAAKAAKKARMAARLPDGDGLFQVDKTKETESKKEIDKLLKITGMIFGAGHDTGDFSAAQAFKKKKAIDSDPFQKIGAFTGAGAASAQENLLRDVRTEIQQMRRVLENRGILVRGTD